jgi:hypothetical protein
MPLADPTQTAARVVRDWPVGWEVGPVWAAAGWPRRHDDVAANCRYKVRYPQGQSRRISKSISHYLYVLRWLQSYAERCRANAKLDVIITYVM